MNEQKPKATTEAATPITRKFARELTRSEVQSVSGGDIELSLEVTISFDITVEIEAEF